jgi:PKD repeat protein
MDPSRRRPAPRTPSTGSVTAIAVTLLLIFLFFAGSQPPTFALAGGSPRALPGVSPTVNPATASYASNATLSVTINASVLAGPAPLAVNFSATVRGALPNATITIRWYFGDETPAATGNFENHTYRTAGSYSVSANATEPSGPNGSGQIVVNVTNPGGALRAVSSSAWAANYTAPARLTFWANVTGGTPPYTVQWNFGNGGTGVGAICNETYLDAGHYEAVGTVTDETDQEVNATVNVTIKAPQSLNNSSPQLEISTDPASGNAPLAERITLGAAGGQAPYTLTVCLGTGPNDGCSERETGWNGSSSAITTTYAEPGRYTIIGNLTDHDGARTTVSTEVTVGPASSPLVATATERHVNGTVPLVVTFLVNISGGTPPYSLQWDFGDGTAGSALPGVPVNHTYASTGTFHPTLAVADSAGHLLTPGIDAVNASPTTPTSHPNGLPPVWYSVTWPFAAALVAAGAVGAALAILLPFGWRRRGRRLRRDGEELVREMQRNSGTR